LGTKVEIAKGIEPGVLGYGVLCSSIVVWYAIVLAKPRNLIFPDLCRIQ
jgi:hypothetical protein